MMAGTGDVLGPLLKLPPLFAVLANPRVAVATPAVFGRLGLAKGARSGLGQSPAPAVATDRPAAMAVLQRGRNDMQAHACALAPAISEVLSELSTAEGAAIVRMSGSGATCFALFEDRAAAVRAARGVARARPGWWVKATVLR